MLKWADTVLLRTILKKLCWQKEGKNPSFLYNTFLNYKPSDNVSYKFSNIELTRENRYLYRDL